MPFSLTVTILSNDDSATPRQDLPVTAYPLNAPLVLRSGGAQIVHDVEIQQTDEDGAATLTLYKDSEVLTPGNWAVVIDKVVWSGPVPEDAESAASILEMHDTYGWGIVARAATPVLAIAGPRGTPSWKGEWASDTTYVPGDAVFDATAGSSYVCIADSLNQEPPNLTYWGLLAEVGAAGAAGSNGTDGTDGNDGSPGADGAPGTPTWKGPWDSGTTYEPGDAVSDGGSSYVANTENTNDEPPTANWDVLAAKGDTGPGAPLSLITVTDDYTVPTNGHTVRMAASGKVITLPDPADVPADYEFRVKNTSAGDTTTVDTAAGTIDGAATYTGLAAAKAAASFVSNGVSDYSVL